MRYFSVTIRYITALWTSYFHFYLLILNQLHRQAFSSNKRSCHPNTRLLQAGICRRLCRSSRAAPTSPLSVLSDSQSYHSVSPSFLPACPRRICRVTAPISVSAARRGCARPPSRHHAELHTPKALPASGCYGKLSLVVQGSCSLSSHSSCFRLPCGLPP